MSKTNLPHDHGHLSDELRLEVSRSHAFETSSELFKLMSDETRVRIFWLLCHCEECVINISALLDMSSPAVSHHLKLLKDSGLIISRRDGKEVYYTAAKTLRSEVLHKMIEEIIEVTCPAEHSFSEADSYDSGVQTINEIHDFLIKDLKTRHTIEELSTKFLINPTTLKSTFKKVFGLPVAAYMKEYRIKKAMELLLTSDISISDIANAVGYENQSKFTSAFKNITGILPKDYRRSNNLS